MFRAARRVERATATALACVVTVATLVILAPAPAAAAPNLSVTAAGPSKVLFGSTAMHSIEACNPGGPGAFNLSFRAVIGSNGIYAGGGDSPSQVINNAPVAGSTTLLWENVSDIPTGACIDVAFDVAHQTGLTTFDVGDSYSVDAGAYTNTDPRYVPDFDGSGVPIPGATSYTGSGLASSATEITAIEIRKDEPGTESELLRGVHDHQTVYTLTVQNNFVNPTSGVTIVDLLPAGIEFLSCGGDNTTDAPTNPVPPIGPPDEEYVGAGGLNPAGALAPCTAPDLVETVLPAGDVFTQVTWNNGGPGFAMAPSDALTFRYLAGIPIRENTMTWTGGSAPATTGAQGANLDNNGGPETAEGDGNEIGLMNTAAAAGTYTRNDLAAVPAGDDHSLTVSAEDLSVHKSVSDATIGQGDIETWTLTIEASEYRAFDDVIVADVLPDGLCPLGLINHDSSDPTGECDPTGDVPTIQLVPFGGPPGPVRNIDYTTVAENANGTWNVGFNPVTDPSLAELASIAESATVIITIPTMTREFYQESSANASPVVANDSWSNTVDIEGTSLVPVIDTDQTVPVQVQDTSSAGQSAPLPVIDKRVADPTLFVPGPLPTACPVPGAAAPPLGAPYVDGPVASYGPGDVACWALRVDFPAKLDTAGATVTDFIPPGHEYVPGSWQVAPGSVPASFTQSGDSLSWTLGSGGDVDVAQVALVIFATQVTDPDAASSIDVSGNLMKFQSNNTAGAVAPQRDQSDVEWAEAELTLLKGVKSINGVPAIGNPPNTDGGTVEGSDVVVYRVDVINGGDRDAIEAEAWDVLPSQISCGDVSAITAPGACNVAEDRVEWSGLTVAQASGLELNYTVTIPSGTSPNETLANLAGVRSYDAATNTGTDFTYYPASNIDGAVTPNTGTASDASSVTTTSLTPAKVGTSSVTETGNADGQATIGERIDYTVTATLPALLTLGSPQFVDALGSRQTLDPASVTATLDDPAPGGTDLTTSPDWDVDTAGNAVTISYLSGNYTGDADGTLMTVSFSATVDNEPANTRGNSITNQATLSWTDQSGNTDSVDSNQVSTTIVEPNLQLAKTEAGSITSVSGGSVLSYRVRLTNPGGPGSVSPAHDVAVVDQLPGGLVTPSAISAGGSWNPVLRQITWTGIDIDPGTTVDLTYTLTVDPDVPAGMDLTNTASATASSLAGTPAAERTDVDAVPGYAASDGYTITAVDASIAKAVDPTSATIGEQVQYTVAVTIPADTVMWDAQITDLLPDGMIYDGTASVICSGCVPAVTPASLTPVANGDGTTTIGWWLSDVASSPAERTLTIVYDSHVADTYNDLSSVSDTDTLANSASLGWNRSNIVAVDPVFASDLGGTDEATGPVAANLTVIEPQLTIDKRVDGLDGADAEPGDSFLYSITVTNTGTAPAHNVIVADLPDAELVNVVPITGAGEITDGWGAADPDMTWEHPGPIPPAGSVVYTYSADLAASLLLNPGDSADNTAAVTEYHGRSEADRSAHPTFGYRTYAGPSDAVTVDLHFPQATLTKAAVDAIPTAVGAPFQWSVTIENTSTVAGIGSLDIDDVLPANWAYDAGSASLDGSPVSDPTVTPDPGGDQLVWTALSGLAPGASSTLTFTATPSAEAQVDPGLMVDHVNAAGAGLTDAAGATGNAAGAYTTNSDTAVSRLAGGSLGDTVWFDFDGNGAVDGIDFPLGGVTVDLTWAGPDGDLSTAADNLTNTIVTAADGTYAFTDLPEGQFEVIVNAATLPAGMTPSFDLDDGTTSPDGGWEGTLGSGVSLLDVDFGFKGTGDLGDTVWFDLDGDGVASTGEPPLEGVTLTLTVPGPDGVLGGGDDVTVTTTTDAAGAYLFGGLYDGEYRVAVDAGSLPGDMAASYDLDSGTTAPDGTWQGLVATGPELGVDFGYRGSGSIGDQVWLDLDGNGIEDLVEPGLPGITVELTWPGEDGVAGNSDDTLITAVTDSLGGYRFDGLPAGTYDVVIPTPPSGLTASWDEDLVFDNATTVVLAAGSPHPTADFGLTGTASIGDSVWFDLNGDALEDAGEPGLPAVEITVTWLGADGASGGGDDVTLPPATTDPTGGYTVAGLPSGAYLAEVTGGLPAGFTATFDEDGTPDGSATLPLIGSGETHTTTDFGFIGSGTIDTAVWLDLNGDAVRGVDEPGIPAVAVTAVWAGGDGIPGNGDDVTFTTVTGPDGTYAFSDLPAGSYTVTLDGADLPAGLASTYDFDGGGDATASVTVLVGETSPEPAFGYVGSATLGDTVWYDLDGDGSLAAAEPGVEGATVTVTHFGVDASAGGGDDIVLTKATDAAGAYLFTGLPDGSFSVNLDAGSLTPGLVPNSDSDGGDPATSSGSVTAGETLLDHDFGIIGTAALTGAVRVDSDGDGATNPADNGTESVGLTVVWDSPAGAVALPVVTDADGTWGLASLPPGQYSVVVDATTLPAGFGLTTPDTTTITLAPGDSASIDTGAVNLASITGVLWIDDDGDGLRGSGETPLGGTISLLDASGSVVGTLAAEPDGTFAFENLLPGTYSVALNLTTMPAGLTLVGAPTVAVVVDGSTGAAVLGFAFVPAAAALPSTGIYVMTLALIALFFLAGGTAVIGLTRKPRSPGR